MPFRQTQGPEMAEKQSRNCSRVNELRRNAAEGEAGLSNRFPTTSTRQLH